MSFVYFDTETTGVPPRDRSLPLKYWPHIVELTAILVVGGETRDELHAIIKPDGWAIPEGAARVHGITTECALAEGKPLAEVMMRFADMVGHAEEVVAHNLEFDRLMVRAELARLFPDGCEAEERVIRARWLQKPGFCTMEAMTPICAIPPTERMVAAGFDKLKPPKLEEAYRHVFDEDLQDAHSATADAMACRRLHEWLIARRGEAA